jgi:UDP-N-acetyl-D-glucosamine dehydrogenase
VDDTRESPSFELIELLRERGATVGYHDPHVPESFPVRKHDLKMKSVDDCVLVSTNHAAFDWAMVAKHARLVVDSRDALRAFHREMEGRIVLA